MFGIREYIVCVLCVMHARLCVHAHRWAQVSCAACMLCVLYVVCLHTYVLSARWHVCMLHVCCVCAHRYVCSVHVVYIGGMHVGACV